MSSYKPLILSEAEPYAETRSVLDNPAVGLYSDAAFNAAMGSLNSVGFAGEIVSEDTALGVPAIWSAVNFLSNQLASLPLQLFTKGKEGPKKTQGNGLYRILHDVVNTNLLTSFDWRKYMMSRLLLTGRAYTFIERNGGGRVMNLWPLDPALVTPREEFNPKTRSPQRYYSYQPPNQAAVRYEAEEIIDLCWMPKADGISHYNPIERNRNAIGLMIGAERWASKLFQNGGLTPMVLETPATSSPKANAQAGEALQDAFQSARDRQRNVIPLMAGFKLTAVGVDPEKAQLLDLKKFQITEVSRIYDIPPSFLHDLSNGTYSNVEQASLSFVRNSLHPWIELWEQQLNTKLFGGRPVPIYAEFNVDALMRGDFMSRMEGLSTAINAALLTPNEARALDNRPAMPGGDDLLIQGATVPLAKAGKTTTPAPVADPDQDPNANPAAEDDQADDESGDNEDED